MELEMHPGVRQVVEFMQRNLPADELRGVANAVAVVAPAVWGQHPEREVHPLGMHEPPISATDHLES